MGIENRLIAYAVTVLALWGVLVSSELQAHSSGGDKAFQLKVVPVVDKVYALVGDTGPRTESNHGLNNTLGFIETEQSVILIGSGTTAASAKAIRDAIRSVTPKAIKYVINIGTQDHHWLGNYYFALSGAEVIALQRTVDAQQTNLEDQLQRLKQSVPSQIDTIRPQHADKVVKSDSHKLTVDGVELQLIWPGKGHFAGDAILWMPQTRTVFSGDLVFMERMLGVHHTSDVAEWHKSFGVMAALKPQHVIPGHGHPTTLEGAQRDSGNYLAWLNQKVGAAIDDWQELDETVEALAEAEAFKHLQHYKGWHRRNVHQTFMQFEAAR